MTSVKCAVGLVYVHMYVYDHPHPVSWISDLNQVALGYGHTKPVHTGHLGSVPPFGGDCPFLGGIYFRLTPRALEAGGRRTEGENCTPRTAV